ncbi:MAG TPA: AMP-binding protein, partial [Ilumatobacteraceae bacterium]|nr:AMP-binding protein [Ilumatobacteraceae bacterium]
MNLSIPQYAKRAVAEFPDVTMSWVDGVGRIDRSIAELGAAVDSVSNGLRQLGLPAGSIIVCQLPNMVENVVLFHAALLAGMVIAPVVPTRGPRDIQQIIATTGARCFVGIDLQEPAAWRDSVTRFGDVGTLSTLVGVHGAGDGAVPWEQLAQTQGPAAPVPDAQAAAVILFTSGTTGRPKAVVHTHRSLLARSLTTIPGADEGEHIEMAVLPSGHIGGAVRAVRMICRGIPTIFLNTWDARRALDLIESDRVTSMGLTPFFLTQLMDQQRA